jgi:hypothetical protein
MSHTANMIAFLLFDLAVIAALALACLVPFRLGRRRIATVVQMPSDRLEPKQWAAA